MFRTASFPLYVLAVCTIYSCSDNTSAICTQMDDMPSDSILTISGSLVVSPKEEFILDTKSKAALPYLTLHKVQLEPCNEKLKKFVSDLYPAYLYEISSEKQMYVNVTGRFLTPKGFEGRPVFTYNTILLIKEQEVGMEDKNIRIDSVVTSGF